MITVNYQPNANQLAKASLLFIEKKPILQIAILFLNIMAVLLTGLALLKFMLPGLTMEELGMTFVCIFWIFARKPISLWFIARKIKKDPTKTKAIEIVLSKNGIVWSGEGLQNGQLAWKYVPYIIKAEQGYILPSSLTRFLWLPLSCFKSPHEIKEFQGLLTETRVKVKKG